MTLRRSAERVLGSHAPDPRQVSRKLRRWFRANGRDLPWRRTRDPYRVLVSELMLQQTQVSRVVDYYGRFLTRFPTLRDLARARQAHVIDAWEGLGYYNRARNLHALAGRVVRDGDGTLPRIRRSCGSCRALVPTPRVRSRPLPSNDLPRWSIPTSAA